MMIVLTLYHLTLGDAVSGIYEIDSAVLESGPHLFILNVRDAFGKTLMKVHQFSIGTGNNRILWFKLLDHMQRNYRGQCLE